MIELLQPALALAALPVLAILLLFPAKERPGQVLRAVLVALLGLALAAPVLQRASRGTDLVVVVDRSRSMPAGHEERALELIGIAEAERGPGDRVAVVSFGREPATERELSESGRFGGFERVVDPDGSDPGAAVDLALALIPEGRAGRVLLLSDGETDREPLSAARRAAARGVEVHVRAAERESRADLSVARFELPPEIDEGAPFQFAAWVRADRAVTSAWRLTRNGALLAQGEQAFEPGMTRLMFRDLVDSGGIASYRLELLSVGDRIPENNSGLAAVRVHGARSVLVLTDDGAESDLSGVLLGAGLQVRTLRPEAADLSATGLTAHRAVVLENVSAGRLGADGLAAVADFVRERGGGLLMTGGRAGFGVGGYHRSALDPVLPVSMELRADQRQAGMALAVVLDRSGSMAAPVAGGVTKMDLANTGTAAAIELLSPIDQITVIAVDSEAHTVLPLGKVGDPAKLAKEVARIESMGGGIYVRTALEAAHEELRKSKFGNRHVVLFADAADAEEQSGVPALLRTMTAEGITVSVIALGSSSDSDGTFLTETARNGDGEVYFTDKPQELPRLFAQDTLVSLKSSLVEEAVDTAPTPELFGLGSRVFRSGPGLGGFNRVYLKPGASAGLLARNEERTPIFAFAPAGLGRAAAFAGQVGGELGAGVPAWSGFGRFFVTSVRWLSVADEPASWTAWTERIGDDLVLRVEAESGEVAAPEPMVWKLRRPDGSYLERELSRVSETGFEARHDLVQPGITLSTLLLGPDRGLQLPPAALSYSSELAHRSDPERGGRTLRRVAELSGGQAAGNVALLLERGSSGSRPRVVTRELALLILLLLLWEIAARRLLLWGDLRGVLARVPVPAVLGRLRPGRRDPAAGSGDRAESGRSSASSSRPAAPNPEPGGVVDGVTEEDPGSAPETGAAPESEAGLGSALSRAREAADRKLKG